MSEDTVKFYQNPYEKDERVSWCETCQSDHPYNEDSPKDCSYCGLNLTDGVRYEGETPLPYCESCNQNGKRSNSDLKECLWCGWEREDYDEDGIPMPRDLPKRKKKEDLESKATGKFVDYLYGREG